MRYTTHIQVRSYETGADGFLHHGHLARFVLHAGNLVTQALGIDAAWYETHGTFFVVRGLHIEFESGARDEETLNVETWLSSARRVRGLREVTITSAQDGRAVANAQLDWVYVDVASLSPARMPADMVDNLRLEAATASRHTWQAGEPAGASHTHHRVVQHHELDVLRHVNTAVYLEWCEQAWCEATGRVPAGIHGHQLEFLRQAVLGDPITIVSQPTTTGVWRQEVRHAGTGEVLVTNLCWAG